MRSAGCAEQVLATGDASLRVNSAGNGPVSAEWMIPKVWLLFRPRLGSVGTTEAWWRRWPPAHESTRFFFPSGFLLDPCNTYASYEM